MADKLSLNLDVVTKSAQQNLKDTSKAATALGDDFDDTRSKAQKIADAIKSSTDQIVTELKADKEAADALAKAIGPEMATTAKAGIDDLVIKLKNLGLTSDEIKADAQALGDAFKHSQDAVSDLQKVDSELDDIEQSAKEAKTAVAGIGDVDTSGASSGVSGVGKELDHVTEKSAKAQGATHGLMGGIAGDAIGAQTGIGPLGEAISQLSEGALEGEVNFKQLGGAIGTMGAAAAAVWLVNSALDKMAAKDAFHQKNVDDYVKSIKAGEDAVTALTERLTEAGKIQLSGITNNFNPMSDAVSDVTDKVLNAGLTVDQFSQLVIGGAPKIDAWVAAQKDAGTWTDNSTTALLAIISASKDYKDAQDSAKTSTAFFKTEIADTTEQTQQYANAAIHADDVTSGMTESQHGAAASADELKAAADAVAAAVTKATDETNKNISALEGDQAAMQDLVDAQRAATDSTFAVDKSHADFNKTLAGVEGQLKDVKKGSVEERVVYDQVAQSAGSVADAHVKMTTDMIASTGATITATEKIDAQNQSLVDTASQASGPSRQAILDYTASINGIPKDTMTAIQAAIDQGDIDTANRLLADASRTRTSTVQADTDSASIAQARKELDDIAKDRVVKYTATGPDGRAITRFAQGTGDVGAPGGVAMVGEHGPELVDLPQGAVVHRTTETERILRDSGGSGSTTVALVVQGNVYGDDHLNAVMNAGLQAIARKIQGGRR